MYGLRNEDENLSFWAKILLLALLLGSGSAAIGPGQLLVAQPTGARGEEIAAEPFRIVIQNDGNLVLYGEGPAPPPIARDGP
jgi:hypothetical protein